MKFLLILLSWIIPHGELFPENEVDILEINTVLYQTGAPKFTQLIFITVGGPNEVLDWRPFPSNAVGKDFPPVSKGWMFIRDSFHKGKYRLIRIVGGVIRSKTLYDVEVMTRKEQPLLFRRQLTPFNSRHAPQPTSGTP